MKHLHILLILFMYLLSSCTHRNNCPSTKMVSSLPSLNGHEDVVRGPIAPKFENYPAQVTGNVNTVPLTAQAKEDISHITKPYEGIDWHQKKIIKRYYKGPNFAGHLTLASTGCGTGCQYNFVINNLSGKVLAFFETATGIAYKINSTLLILNPPLRNMKVYDESRTELKNSPVLGKIKTRFMIWDGQTFNEILKDDLYKFLDAKNYLD